MPQPMIRAGQLQKLYPLESQVVIGLDNINLTIMPGEFVAIMGPSGSGKSTLLYLMGGLDRPSSGQLEIAGTRIDTLNSDDLAAFRRETIGFVFQSFHLVPTLPAIDNVALPGVFSGVERYTRLDRAWRLLNALGLADRTDHLPKQLSGGQRQRVAIARALFNDPPLIMADEPTGSLDSKTGSVVMRLLRTLCRRRGKTIIVVTHDPGVAQYADRVLRLKDGQLIGDVSRRIMTDTAE
jgi:ABC-type lipoprotein export system ATPase subunit